MDEDVIAIDDKSIECAIINHENLNTGRPKPRRLENRTCHLTQGMFDGRKIIRFQVGQFDTTRDDVLMAADVIRDVWEAMK